MHKQGCQAVAKHVSYLWSLQAQKNKSPETIAIYDQTEYNQTLKDFSLSWNTITKAAVF